MEAKKKESFKVGDRVIRLNSSIEHDEIPKCSFDPGDIGIITEIHHRAYSVRCLKTKLIYLCVPQNLAAARLKESK